MTGLANAPGDPYSRHDGHRLRSFSSGEKCRTNRCWNWQGIKNGYPADEQLHVYNLRKIICRRNFRRHLMNDALDSGASPENGSDEPLVLDYTVVKDDFTRAGGHPATKKKSSAWPVSILPPSVRSPSACTRARSIWLFTPTGRDTRRNLWRQSQDDSQRQRPRHWDVDKAMQAGWSTASEEARNLGFGAGMGLPNMKKEFRFNGYSDRHRNRNYGNDGLLITEQ